MAWAVAKPPYDCNLARFSTKSENPSPDGSLMHGDHGELLENVLDGVDLVAHFHDTQLAVQRRLVVVASET